MRQIDPEKVTYEVVTVQSEGLTVDHLIWRRYRRNTRGIVELAMDVNPEVAKAHKYGPFLPVGLVIKIPIVRSQLQGGPVRAAAITLYGTE